MGRFYLCFLSSAGLSLFMSFHRFVSWSEGRGLFSLTGPVSERIAWESSKTKTFLLVVLLFLLGTSSFAVFRWVLNFFERRYLKLKTKEIVRQIGSLATNAGIVFSVVFALFSALFILLDTSLLNAWDMSYLVILIGMMYIATFYDFLYAVPLDRWAAKDPAVELEKLKIDHEELRICFKYFVWALVAIIGGQVFVALRLKFAPFYSQPEKFANEIEKLRPVMALNTLQVAFLMLVAWAMILTRFLRRMEEVKFRLMELKLPRRK